MVKCVCYMGLTSNSCFMTGTALMGGHYRTDIISDVGYPMSDSVVLLMICMIVYNTWGTDVVLLVHQDYANPARKG